MTEADGRLLAAEIATLPEKVSKILENTDTIRAIARNSAMSRTSSISAVVPTSLWRWKGR